MLWRFLRTKPFIDSYSASRDRWSNASPLFLGPPLSTDYLEISINLENVASQQSAHV